MSSHSPQSSSEKNHDHFQGKDALQHVAERQVEGIITYSEIHGEDIPGHLAAFASGIKDTALLLGINWICLSILSVEEQKKILILLLFSLAWMLWKMGHSSLNAWTHLERLHRITEEERHEIENHRDSEREELKVIYAAKGFKGKLLEDVLDVLMADDNRLLKVMLEEELGLKLQSQEHPLKQGLYALLGSFCSASFCLICLWTFHFTGLVLASMLSLSLGSILICKIMKNHLVSAVVWQLSLACLVFGSLYYFVDFFF